MTRELVRQEPDVKLVDWAERIIQQRHYETLDTLSPRVVDAQIDRIRPGDVSCLFRVTELVCRREEGCLSRLTTVLNALHSAGASCLMLLQCQNGRSELYLGAVNKQRYGNLYYMNTIREILRTGLEGNLPGTELTEIVSRREIEYKLAQCLDNGFDSQCVTAVSCVPGELPEKGALAGMETLLEAVGNQNFTLMVLADPVDREQIRVIRKGYEDLSTQLSAISEMSVSLQSSSSTTVTENFSKSFTKTMGQSLSMTQSHTAGTGWSRGSSRGETENTTENKVKKAAITAGSLFLGNNSIFAMNALSSMFVNPASVSVNEGTSGSESDSDSRTSGTNESTAQGQTRSAGRSDAKTEGVTFQTTTKNRHTQELLDRVEWYLTWLNRCENYGMFNCAAYVISGSAGTNMMVSSQYQALMQGTGDMSQSVTVNTWTRENGVERVRGSLMHMQHPVMECRELQEGLTPAMLMSSRELSRQMALPQHSVVGVSVMEYAAYGREVVRKTPLRSGKVLRVGAVSHMGKTVANQPVLLDLQSMAAHTFVAGTNGSGKSNTVFRILEELMAASIPFMVIEPAKGEYKNVFGREKNVQVYGTNSRKTRLLRLNPFWFNPDVDVLEHIDKLIDVFTASWPMYAAMPAVLKAAIENAYRSCGWDLKRSCCRGGQRIFPTVEDVLGEFNNKMNSTAFSEEVKGNYVGALSTRLESLCNGIYGEIFGGSNLTDQELFDSNVIIDLSRVGAAETKSMIMGMLIIRLQEYRMSGEAMNLPLKHITVLEEAHHLLRRTSTAQGAEGGNMLGKSVEMISNAIAEMRSYGEGFVIVDQSPGLLDMSVMRNTNTKMILRLPEAGDRDMVGNTMGLTPEQINELSHLKTGVCAIYQKDWLEAVLCQVDRAKHDEVLYRCDPGADPDEKFRTKIVKALLHSENPPADLAETVLLCGISGTAKKALLQELFSEKANEKLRRSMILQLVQPEFDLPYPMEAEPVQVWFSQLVSDSGLCRRWGSEDLPQVICFCLEQLAAEDPQWAQVTSLLGGPFSLRDQALRAARGRAFARMCPLHCKASPLTQERKQTLAEDVGRLAEGREFDRKLAALLQNSLDTGDIRQKKQLRPYTDLVWELMGGQTGWDALLPLMDSSRPRLWDREARQRVQQYLDADRDTVTSLLSLYLQKKGALPPVRDYFAAWHLQKWQSDD